MLSPLKDINTVEEVDADERALNVSVSHLKMVRVVAGLTTGA